jgi:outer membrane scaffolding protein for murein synthesis (MipA/OmpV family)
LNIVTSAMRCGLALPLAASLLDPTGLFGARAAGAEEAKGYSGYLAGGGAFVPGYEGSKDYHVVPFAAARLSYDNYYVEARGPKLRANVLPSFGTGFGIEAGPAVAYRFKRTNVKDARVDALREIDNSFAVGGFVKITSHGMLQKSDELAFEVEALTGVGEHKSGTTISFGPSYSFSPFDRTRLGFKAFATYADDQYNQTYFGIDADNALRSGFSVYDAKAGIKDASFSTTLSYALTKQWAVTGTVGVKRLMGAAADGPIVKDAGSATQGFLSTGIAYRF